MNTKQIITIAALIASPLFTGSAFADECFGRAGVCLEQITKWSSPSTKHSGAHVATVQGRGGPAISLHTSKPNATFANYERLYNAGRG